MKRTGKHDSNKATKNHPKFSAIVTSFFEEASIQEFYNRLSGALESIGQPYEIIMVNDGSTDGTFEKMRGIFAHDPNVSAVIDFFKNSGQLAAMTAGICQARGDVIIFIDSDLQLAPEELPSLVSKYDEGFDLVSGYRLNRKDSLSRIIPSKIANWIMRKVSESTIRDFGCTFKLYNAVLLRGFQFGPHNIFNTAHVVSKIQRYAEVPVSHLPRKYGKSGWTFRKLWKFNMDNVVNLSERPFQTLSILCLLVATLVILRIAADFILPFQALSTVSNGLLLNGILVATLFLLSTLCLIGEFTIRTFLMTQQIPYYIIREKLER